jgi:ubiquinone/menaquinone biosynthesis C-methylase UbiE
MSEIMREEESKQPDPENNISEFWHKGTIEHQRQPLGGRGLSIYEKQLLFDRHELSGKKVLDLGAGPDVKFAKELKQSGIQADVVSLSPDFVDEKYLKEVKKSFPEGKFLAGLGQNLPFGDESFDKIFAFHVQEHISQEVLLKFVSEIARVLKRGGDAKIGPIINTPTELDYYKEILEDNELIKKLDAISVSVVKEQIPEAVINKIKVQNRFSDSFYELSYNIVIKKAIDKNV